MDPAAPEILSWASLPSGSRARVRTLVTVVAEQREWLVSCGCHRRLVTGWLILVALRPRRHCHRRILCGGPRAASDTCRAHSKAGGGSLRLSPKSQVARPRGPFPDHLRRHAVR